MILIYTWILDRWQWSLGERGRICSKMHGQFDGSFTADTRGLWSWVTQLDSLWIIVFWFHNNKTLGFGQFKVTLWILSASRTQCAGNSERVDTDDKPPRVIPEAVCIPLAQLAAGRTGHQQPPEIPAGEKLQPDQDHTAACWLPRKGTFRKMTPVIISTNWIKIIALEYFYIFVSTS